MPSQRITVAKLAGVSGDIAFEQISGWFAARTTNDPNMWSREQWPDQVRQEADDFAERLRVHGFDLPVCYFVEWADLWSMGHVFSDWLTPPNCQRPIEVHCNRFEILAHSLPDGGRLLNHLSTAGPQQFPETDWYIACLREAVSAWEKLVPRAKLVVLRNVIGGFVDDEEVIASMESRPQWLL